MAKMKQSASQKAAKQEEAELEQAAFNKAKKAAGKPAKAEKATTPPDLSAIPPEDTRTWQEKASETTPEVERTPDFGAQSEVDKASLENQTTIDVGAAMTYSMPEPMSSAKAEPMVQRAKDRPGFDEAKAKADAKRIVNKAPRE